MWAGPRRAGFVGVVVGLWAGPRRVMCEGAADVMVWGVAVGIAGRSQASTEHQPGRCPMLFSMGGGIAIMAICGCGFWQGFGLVWFGLVWFGVCACCGGAVVGSVEVGDQIGGRAYT